MYEKFDRDRHLIPKGSLIDIKYEDFIQDAMGHMKRIYATLQLEGYEQAEPFFQEYVDSQQSYKPNRHILSSDSVKKVNAYWGHIVDRFGYQKLDPSTAPEEGRVEIPS
jgi:hypothetical protein